ncbi:MAG: CPBP family intramembrane metalloprotease [Actinomycetota bacterium]|nr:CPBP family intramembrane metalloprotease [Actinomycetota bacterium]
MGLIGVTAPVPPFSRVQTPVIPPVLGTALGFLAVVAVAAVAPPLPVQVSVLGVGAGLAAALAEEAFFRRFLYGWLLPHGVLLAIGVSAVAFAIVHVPVYGILTLPINLAAGLLLGWQRWATGSWTSAAATHGLANLLGMGVIS